MSRKHKRRHSRGRAPQVRKPNSLPFMDAICAKMNMRVNEKDERGLLSTYERYWILNGNVATVNGDEKAFLFSLARKHHSFIARDLA